MSKRKLKTKKYFVTSDIHSFMDPFFTALINSGFDNYNPDHILIVCGDAFDRGKDAVRVYKYLKELYSKNKLIYIRGNHEDLIFDCVKQLKENGGCAQSHHYSNGTVDTVVQFMEEDLLDEALDFIKKVSINYFEVGKYVFVHGWVPYVLQDGHCESGEISAILTPIIKLDAEEFMWKEARWYNGMKEASNDIIIPGKTIVCGHWHTGWGHYVLHHEGFSQFDKFDIYEDIGVIALDACTAYSNKVNILTIEV